VPKEHMSPMANSMTRTSMAVENQAIGDMERKIRVLQASMILMELKLKKLSKVRAFRSLQSNNRKLDSDVFEDLASE